MRDDKLERRVMDKSELVRAALFGVFAKAGTGSASRICLYDLHEAVRRRGAPCPRLVLDLMVAELLLNGLIRDITGGELNDATCLENLYIIPDDRAGITLVSRLREEGELDNNVGVGEDFGVDDDVNLDWPEGRVSEQMGAVGRVSIDSRLFCTLLKVSVTPHSL